MARYARILEDEGGEEPGTVVEIIAIGDRWDSYSDRPTLVYKGKDRYLQSGFVSGFGRYELLPEGFDPDATPEVEPDPYAEVTRITLVFPDGMVWEKYGAFPSGVELHLQDDGRTLKIFPKEARA